MCSIDIDIYPDEIYDYLHLFTNGITPEDIKMIFDDEQLVKHFNNKIPNLKDDIEEIGVYVPYVWTIMDVSNKVKLAEYYIKNNESYKIMSKIMDIGLFITCNVEILVPIKESRKNVFLYLMENDTIFQDICEKRNEMCKISR